MYNLLPFQNSCLFLSIQISSPLLNLFHPFYYNISTYGVSLGMTKYLSHFEKVSIIRFYPTIFSLEKDPLNFKSINYMIHINITIKRSIESFFFFKKKYRTRDCHIILNFK